MRSTPHTVIFALAAAFAVSGCQATEGPAAAQIAPPVAGQLAAMIEGSGSTDQDYDLVPGPDGRVFLVLDCAAAEGAPSLTARRADGRSWGAASPDAELSVRCDADGQRLAILAKGSPGQRIPLDIVTSGDEWRVSQTYQRPNG